MRVSAAIGTPPAAPGALRATAPTSSSIDVKWADNSSTEAGFQVRRSIHADFSASTVLATLGAGTTNYLDTAVSAGTAYYYRVRAVSAVGNSPFSNTLSATPRMEDTDGDDIPDPLESAPYVIGVDDREIDSDGDGFSNTAEYAADTDPLDALSRPQIAQMTAASADSVVTDLTLYFFTVAGLHYSVEFTDSLIGGIWTLVPGPARIGDGAQQSVSDFTDSKSRFYRLQTWR